MRPPAWPTEASLTTLANLSPMGTIVMPFMPRMVSRATIASALVSGFWVLSVMVVVPATAAWPAVARSKVRPTSGAYTVSSS